MIGGIYEDDKPNRSLVGDRYDKDYLRSTGKLRVKAPDGDLQAVIAVDSYPAMFPERLDVDDPGAGLAANARMFAENWPKIKGRLRSKRIAILGVNQLRTAPMVRFGNPEYEPGGNALKLFSDVRMRMASRAISAVDGAKSDEKNKAIETEDSVLYENGKDSYRYVHMQAHKNKLSQGNHATFARLWLSDPAGEAWGYDPVYDTFTYLEKTGQVEGSRKKMRLCIKGFEPAKKEFGWSVFKKLILGDKEFMQRVYEGCKMKPMLLRNYCFRQIREGTALDMFYETMKEDAPKKKEKADEDDDD